MKLTSKLIGFLNRVFDKTPASVAALRIDNAATMSWVIADEVLTIKVPGVQQPLVVQLGVYTMASLAAFVALQPGFTVSYLDPDLAGLSACVLLDGSNDTSLPNGNVFPAYTSVLWGYLDAVSAELTAAEAQIAPMLAQMVVPTAGGVWLDEVASYYGVKRLARETDATFAPRVIAAVVRPRGNGVAIENAILAMTGQVATVQDVVVTQNVQYAHNGVVTRNGAYTHSSTAQTAYGLFDVSTAFDFLNGDPRKQNAALIALVEIMRDAGTHMRALNITGGVVTDAFAGESGEVVSPLNAALPLTDGLAPPDDASAVPVRMALSAALADTNAGADDSTDSISISSTAAHNGAHLRDGRCLRFGGLTLKGDMGGAGYTATPTPTVVRGAADFRHPEYRTGILTLLG